LIEEVGTSREGRRPERTDYKLTAAGEQELQDWLRQLLAKPAHERSSFVAALSYLGHLGPEEAVDQLEIRARELDCGIVAMSAVMERLTPQIGRLPLVEAEYVIAQRKSELEWVRALIDDIRAGRLAWTKFGVSG